jgi:YYY domain-containing protein
MAVEIAIWWLIAQALGLAGLPLAGLAFAGLPDGGYPFAKALGLLLTGYLAWLLAMFGLGGFGAPLLVACALAVGGAGLWARRAEPAPRRPMLPPWPTILGYEAIFLAALLACVWMRAHDPTPWGTERPMDFAFFNAIQRSPTFPPSDPWLAGYSINYYYFGYLLMAAVSQLSGLAPSVAYNLSLALIFALTALGVAGVVGNLIALASRGQEAKPSELEATGRLSGLSPVGYTLFPLLGALLVLVAGNQSGAIQVLLGDERAVVLDGPQLASAAGQALGGADSIALPYPASSGDFGELSDWERQDRSSPGAFNWWWPSRSLWDEYAVERQGEPPARERRYNITEFPLFSFRLGDMHPHVMSLPFTLLALALALAVLAHPEAPRLASGRLGWAELLVSGVILGGLYAINSWDLPTYLLLYAGAALVVERRLAGDDPVDWLAYGRRLGLAVLASFLLFLPFYLTFHSLVGGAEPLIDLPIIGRLTSIIAPYPDSRSGLHALLIIFGLFIIPLAAFVYLVRAGSNRPPAAGRRWSNAELLPWLPPALLLIGLLIGFPMLAMFGLGALALSLALRLGHRPAESFALLVVALGCAILFGTEVIYIRDLFSTRMNTIFKFYYQVWLLWGALAPFALWHILARARGARRIVGLGVAAAFALLLAGAAVYPALALRDLGRGELIGLEAPTPREQTEGGRQAIAWLRASAAPGSVILEAADVDNIGDASAGAAPICGGAYNGDGFAGVSAASGLPTVLGWTWHETQWRGGDLDAAAQLQPRCADVYTIYHTTDAALARQLLDKYGVRYVYVGGLERRDYPPESLAKFGELGAPMSFGDGEVTIYTVR